MRALALAVLVGCMVGLIAFLLDQQNVLRVLISGMAASVLFLLVTWEPVSVWLPRVALERGDGWAVRARGPVRRWAGRSKAKLRKETLSLVKEMHDFLAAQPAASESYTEWGQRMKEMNAAKDDAERHEIHMRYTLKLIQRGEEEKRALEARFGGRVRHVIQGYVQRGMLPRMEVLQLEWQAHSLMGLADAAMSLEALARRL